MGYVNVHFLDSEYRVSEAINEFLHYDELLTPIRIKVIDTISQGIKSDAHNMTFGNHIPEYVDRSAKSFIKLMEDGANILINKLFSMGIYDVTVEELLGGITCIEDINVLERKTFSTMLAEGQKYVDMKNAGMERAYRSAAGNITGSGVMLFTSSITNLLIHSVVERSILLNQAKKADKEYEEAVKAINASTRSALDSMVSTVMLNQYYPAVMDILMEFDSKIMSAFLVELVQHGKFDFDSVQNYNMEKAENMLTNISRVPDKVEFLKQVFNVCPYSMPLYETVMELGLLDINTFRTAEYFGFGNILAEKLEEYIRNNSSDKSKIESAVTILATHGNTDEKSIWRKIHSERIGNIERAYSDFHSALVSRAALDTFIRKNVSSDMRIIASKSREEVSKIVSEVLSATVNNHQFAEFIKMELLSVNALRISGSAACELKEINDELAGELVRAIMCYIEEANHRLQRYEQAKAQLDNELKVMLSELADLRERKAKLGFFSIAKKKELVQEIANTENAIEEYEKNHESKRLLKEFEHMC